MWVLLSVMHWCGVGLRPAMPGQAVLQGQLWGGDDDDDGGGCQEALSKGRFTSGGVPVLERKGQG